MIPSSAPHPPDRMAALVAAHQEAVWRYLRFLGAEPLAADDLTQDAFVAAWDKPIDRFGPGGARAYLRQTARNLWLKHLRARRRSGEVVDPELAEAAWQWAQADGDDGGGRAVEALRACVQGLRPDARHALDLRFSHRLSREATAGALGLSEDGVKTLLRRTYARPRACIERRLNRA